MIFFMMLFVRVRCMAHMLLILFDLIFCCFFSGFLFVLFFLFYSFFFFSCSVFCFAVFFSVSNFLLVVLFFFFFFSPMLLFVCMGHMFVCRFQGTLRDLHTAKPSSLTRHTELELLHCLTTSQRSASKSSNTT